ncbi:MAG TPA: ester cyclase [Gemmatimonadaceae bacterium]|nr:ester cyclase [Gemmatimonadaceae bacterium]
MAALTAAACSQTATKDSDTSLAGAPSQTVGDSAKMIAQNLMKFDTLDFDVFSNQKWDRLKESHAQDIIVSWPDGHDTHGIDKHIEDLKAMFVALPDLKITEHPIKIANGHWTSVTGRMVGTFSKPMPLGKGKFVQPTGKKLDMTMATIGHWTDAGVMDHEWLFWDNQTYMKQLGLIP